MESMITLLLFTMIARSASQDFNTLSLSQMNNIRYECLGQSCLPPSVVSVLTLRDCGVACLMNTNCRTLTYDPSNNQCLLFSDISSQYGNLVAQADVVTSTATDDRTLSTRVATTGTTFSTTATYIASSLWKFENNSLDSMSRLNGVGVNSPAFVTPDITGRGYALSLNGITTQYVNVSTYQNFSYTSFTVEMWIYPTAIDSNSCHGLFSQRESATMDHLFIFMVWYAKLSVSFYNDDLMGATTLLTNTWYHAAVVYDYPSRTQVVYLNGYEDGRHTSAGPYLGTSGAITIGMFSDYVAAIQCFNGYIDEVSLIMRAKNASEILTDATLTSWHSFDSTPLLDSGPLGLKTTAANVTSVPGRVNQVLSFTSNSSYYQVNGFVLLGVSNRTYSLSLRTKRATTGGAVVVHLSTTTNGQGWCVDLIGFSSTGQIIVTVWQNSGTQVVGPTLPINIWTHVTSTYSITNGGRLYIDGTLVGMTGAMPYKASGAVNILTLANALQGPTGGMCNSASIVPAVYFGDIDEFRVYSRELNATTIYALANPQ